MGPDLEVNIRWSTSASSGFNMTRKQVLSDECGESAIKTTDSIIINECCGFFINNWETFASELIQKDTKIFMLWLVHQGTSWAGWEQGLCGFAESCLHTSHAVGWPWSQSLGQGQRCHQGSGSVQTEPAPSPSAHSTEPQKALGWSSQLLSFQPPAPGSFH